MLNYIRSEFYRVFHSKGIYVTLALLAACAILINALLACFGAVSPDFAYDNTSFAMQFLLQLPLLYPFAALLIVYVLYEGAGKNGNLKNAVAFGVSREKLLAGQFVVSTIVSLAAMVVTLGVYFACAYALLDFDATIAGTEVIRQVLCVLPTAIASLILALLCVNMTERGFVGILVWLLVMILIPEIFRYVGYRVDAFARIADWMPGHFMDLQNATELFWQTSEGVGKCMIAGGAGIAVFGLSCWLVLRRKEM